MVSETTLACEHFTTEETNTKNFTSNHVSNINVRLEKKHRNPWSRSCGIKLDFQLLNK